MLILSSFSVPSLNLVGNLLLLLIFMAVGKTCILSMMKSYSIYCIEINKTFDGEWGET